MPIHQHKIKSFIEAISSAHPESMFNPWGQDSEGEVQADAGHARRIRLASHLNISEVSLLLVGEAAGYQGCRFSGIPFTSERLLLEGQIPRIPALKGRITTRVRPWSEPSATIVWGILQDLNLAEYTVLFNAVPWHPEGKRGPLSNRSPSKKEQEMGLPFLEQAIALFPEIPIAALGNIASASLNQLGVKHTRVRHPAYGGAGKFREGLRELVAISLSE